MNVLVSPKEAAQLLSVSLSTIMRLLRAGQIASINIGKARRIRSTDLLKFAQVGTNNTKLDAGAIRRAEDIAFLRT